MGLAVFVGLPADLRSNDAEGFQFHQDQFARLNQRLAELGLPPHSEPLDCEYWDGEMFGYSGLHYLRRVAAHLQFEGTLPAPGDSDATANPLLGRYYARATSTARWVQHRTGTEVEAELGFDHLLLHSDAEGYYLPLDFADVIIADDLVGGTVGSSPRLLAECRRLAEALGIPADLDPDADIVWQATDEQGQGQGWQRYGIEAFTCVRLIRAAEYSIARGAAIVFS